MYLGPVLTLPSHKHLVSCVAAMHAMLMTAVDDDDDGDVMDEGLDGMTAGSVGTSSSLNLIMSQQNGGLAE